MFLAVPYSCCAHGVTHEVFEVGTGVRATYDDGSPMAYCDVTVCAPGRSESEFQAGATDRNGCFAFVPDTNGTWRVSVDDGMGHLVRAEIEVGPNVMESKDGGRGQGRLGRAVVGVSIIFGVFALLGRGSLIGRANDPDGSDS